MGTTDRTYQNALTLMTELGVTLREIPIREACALHYGDIGHDPTKLDVTFENVQARERTQILMDVANQVGGLVVGTGDLSELALGWCTYNGDHMSHYGVNAGVPKSLVRHLVSWYAETTGSQKVAAALRDILDTPLSPELLPADQNGKIAQKTEDVVGPYELHDFFLFHVLRNGFTPKKILKLATIAFDGKYEPAEILKWLGTFYRRFFSQQFKRSCLPDGVKIGSVCLSPRGDWRMPSDADASTWLAGLKEAAEELQDGVL
jgi:NAD+ synthase (glutamine-hydrolysing)